MNFVFSSFKTKKIPKYVTGSNCYYIDINKYVIDDYDNLSHSAIYLINEFLKNEFLFALKKNKSCIYYINPNLSVNSIKNVKRILPQLGINIKKFYFLSNKDDNKIFHDHVDSVINEKK